MRRLTIPALAAMALAVAVWAAPLAAQDGVGFRFAFGHQTLGGELGEVLDGTVDAEFSILRPVGPVRVGGGANWASFQQDGAEASWSQITFHGLVGLPLRVTDHLRVYAEGRYTFRRLRPEDDRFFGGEEALLRDFVASGSGFEGVAGVEIVLHPRVAIDLSGSWGRFSVSPDLTEEGLGPRDSGTGTRAHVGLTWFPVNGR